MPYARKRTGFLRFGYMFKGPNLSYIRNKYGGAAAARTKYNYARSLRIKAARKIQAAFRRRRKY